MPQWQLYLETIVGQTCETAWDMTGEYFSSSGGCF